MFSLLSLCFIDQTVLIFSRFTDTSRTSDSTPTRVSSTTATTPPRTSSSAAPASTSPPSTIRTLNSSTATSSINSAASAPWRKLRPASNGPPPLAVPETTRIRAESANFGGSGDLRVASRNAGQRPDPGSATSTPNMTRPPLSPVPDSSHITPPPLVQSGAPPPPLPPSPPPPPLLVMVNNVVPVSQPRDEVVKDCQECLNLVSNEPEETTWLWDIIFYIS